MESTTPHNKPSLLMIHGLIGSQHYYEPQSRLRGIWVHTPDLLGYGDWVSVPPSRLTLASQADHIAGVLDRLSTPKVWLLGHSMGGGIAMLVADRRPERIAGVINVEGNFTLKRCLLGFQDRGRIRGILEGSLPRYAGRRRPLA
jgi:pimeloyl-ACP methyl ester carboxylesterase